MTSWIVGCWPATVGPPYSVVEIVRPNENEARADMEKFQEEILGIPWFYERSSPGLEKPGDRYYPQKDVEKAYVVKEEIYRCLKCTGVAFFKQWLSDGRIVFERSPQCRCL